jgi:hypothetical protein
MNRKLTSAIILLVLVSATIFSCKKSSSPQAYSDNLYFPTGMGHYVTYAVDSMYYFGANCNTKHVTCQVRYTVSDTCRDAKFRPSFIVDVRYRYNDTSNWIPSLTNTVIVTPTASGLEYAQNNVHSTKLSYPIASGAQWYAFTQVPPADSNLQYLMYWTSTYPSASYKTPYNSGSLYFDNTISVLLDDETIQNTVPDSITFTYRSYAKEVYALNVGMVYREVTRLSYNPYSTECINGVSVTMKAIDHN